MKGGGYIPFPAEGVRPARIEFGDGVAGLIPSVLEGLGRRVFVVTGAHPERHAGLLRELGRAMAVGWFRVMHEPTVADAMEGAVAARESGADVVIAMGGGSVMDAGKAVAALATNPGDPCRHLEVIGEGRPLESKPLPVVAVPTTAGTGAEATRNAVLASPAHRVKVSLRSPDMVPVAALVDPALTWELPPSVTAASGLDALTQLLEAFVCSRATPMTDALCRCGLARVGGALEAVLADPRDAAARRDMAWCSLASGLALTNAGLGVVHGFAGPLGGLLPIAHGVACAALLPHGTRANIEALEMRGGTGDALARYDEAARLLTGDPASGREGLPEWLGRCVRGRVPTLAACGLGRDAWPGLVSAARRASSMKANPVELSEAELLRVLRYEAAVEEGEAG